MSGETVATLSSDSPRRTCDHCGESLNGRPQKRYCSAACRAQRFAREHPRLGQVKLPFNEPFLPLPTLRVPDPESRPRLQKACRRILARLAEGPATNLELAAVGGLRFGARLKECRDGGYDIPEPDVDRESGRAVYRLRS